MTKLSSFEKRVKRRIIGPTHSFYAVCQPGLETVCKSEIIASGVLKKNLKTSRGGVEFEDKLAKTIELNLGLASPSRILMRISQFKADSFGKLEKRIAAIDWELYLAKNCQIKIKATARKSRLYHSDAIAQRCEKTILDHLEKNAVFESCLKEPSVQTIYIRADHDRITVSIDSSGELLYKRGTKQKVTAAPLRENIAFAMLFWAGFSKDDILVDPMCGSGTFSLEAALIKSGLPPGFFRSFAFESWPAFSQKAFAHLKKQAQKNMESFSQKQIFASDADNAAVHALAENILPHKYAQMIDIRKKDFFSLNPLEMNSLKPTPSNKGVIMLNPPYGKRLGKQDTVPDFFYEIAKKLKADFKGWRLSIILPDKSSVTALGLPLKFRPVFHGGLDVIIGTGTI